MRCHDVDSSLVAYLYDELSEEQKGQVEAHIGACPECAAKVGSFQGTRRSLAAMECVEPSAIADQRIIIRAREAAANTSRPGLLRWLFVPSTAGLVMTGFAVVVGFVLFLRTPLSEGPAGGPGTMTAGADRSTMPVDVPEAKIVMAEAERAAMEESVPPTAAMPAPALRMASRKSAYDPARALFERGKEIPSRENPFDAIDAFMHAIEADPQGRYAPSSLYEIAKIYNNLGDYKCSAETLEMLRRDYPDYQGMPEVYAMHSEICRKLGKYDEADESFKDLVVEFPDHDQLIDGVFVDYSGNR
ncbi:zf-HC2 domain-containing protein [Thermodesulfobacteriota bacterium]